jgi:hypothetical protein
MDVSELRKLSERYWKQGYREDMSALGQAKFITGMARNDLFFHHMLVEHGVEFLFKQLTLSSWKLEDYNIVDKEKYLMFVLKWS